MLVGDLLRERAHDYGEEEFYRFGDQVLSYASLEMTTNKIANALLAMGIGQGDRIAILGRTSINWPIIWLANAKIGATNIPINFKLSHSQIEHILKDSQSKLVFYDNSFGDLISELKLRGDNNIKSYISLEKSGTDDPKFDELLDLSSAGPPITTVDWNRPWFIMYTSGTTGNPKACQLTQKNFLANTANAHLELGMGQKDVYLHCSPIFYISSIWTVVLALYSKCRYVLLDGFKAREYLMAVEKYRPTVTFLVPTMINDLITLPEVKQCDLSSLRLLIYGASSIALSRLKEAMQVLPCGFMQIYGMTEVLISHVLPPKEHLDATTGEEKAQILRSCGRPFINCDSIIIDDDGKSLEAGIIGEIAIRSQTVMLGYCNETETGDVWVGEYVKTGDLGYKDENGFFYIVDRKKDIIISGAEKISSKDVEEVLATHPSVLEAAVIGIPDERWGESIRGIVVLRPGVPSISEQELMNFCAEKLGRFKRPKSIIYVDQMPRNTSGKILKAELKKRFSSQ